MSHYKVKPITLTVQEHSRGLNPSAWIWEISSTAGGVLRILARGRTETPSGAVYAAVMEARLYDPSFAPSPEDLDAYQKAGER